MARVTHYDIDDLWTPQASFTVGGTATDPTALTVKQQTAAGVESTLLNAVDPATLNASSTPVAKTGTGVFKLNPGITLDAAGYWFVRFKGTGAAAAAEEHQAIVDPSEFTTDAGVGTRALVGLAETKDWLQSQNIQTGEDLDLVRVINDISDRFHQEAQREFKVAGTNPQTRTFDVDRVSVRTGVQMIGDLAAAPTTVEIIDRDWTTVLESVVAANYALEPLVRESWEPIRRIDFNYWNGVTYLRYGYRVRVAGTWGFPSVPGNVRQAVLDAVAATMDRDVEHYRQDLGAATAAAGGGGAGTVIMVGGGRQQFVSLPPSSLAVAWKYRDLQVG